MQRLSHEEPVGAGQGLGSRPRAPGGWVAALACAAMLMAMAAPALAGREAWTPFGPDGSGFNTLAVDPADPQTLYGATTGRYEGNFGPEGVVVSHDGGTSWRPASSGIAGQRVVAIGVDPGHPGRVFALATFSGFPTPIAGVLRSDDGGMIWAQLTGERDFLFSYSLLVLPDAVLVGTDQAILRSTDGGVTWSKVYFDRSTSVQFHTLVADPTDPRVIYAANLDYRLKSSDGGLTWGELLDPLQHGFHPFINAFALAPSEPTTLYETGSAAITGDATWRSRNGGATWEGPFNFGARTLLVDPRDPRTLFAGRSDGLYRSRDGGETWQRLRGGNPPPPTEGFIFNSIHAFAADSSGAILAATAAGLVRSRDGGGHWRLAAGHGLHDNLVTVVVEDPFDAAHWVVRSFDRFLATGDGGQSFAPTALALTSLQYLEQLAFDPFTPNRLLALTPTEQGSDLLESRDGGDTWQPTALHPPIYTFAISLLTPRSWLATSPDAVYRTGDAGRTWHAVLRIGDEDKIFSPTGVVTDPRRPGVVWVLGYESLAEPPATVTAQIYRSNDFGRTWSLWTTGFSILLPDPRRTGAAWLSDGRTVARTRDDGGSFETVGQTGQSAGAVITSLVLDHGHPGGLFAATVGSGAFHSLDGGATWTAIDAGLPNGLANGAQVAFLVFVPDAARPGRLWAALSTGGLWRGDFALP